MGPLCCGFFFTFSQTQKQRRESCDLTLMFKVTHASARSQHKSVKLCDIVNLNYARHSTDTIQSQNACCCGSQRRHHWTLQCTHGYSQVFKDISRRTAVPLFKLMARTVKIALSDGRDESIHLWHNLQWTSLDFTVTLIRKWCRCPANMPMNAVAHHLFSRHDHFGLQSQNGWWSTVSITGEAERTRRVFLLLQQLKMFRWEEWRGLGVNSASFLLTWTSENWVAGILGRRSTEKLRVCDVSCPPTENWVKTNDSDSAGAGVWQWRSCPLTRHNTRATTDLHSVKHIRVMTHEIASCLPLSVFLYSYITIWIG